MYQLRTFIALTLSLPTSFQTRRPSETSFACKTAESRFPPIYTYEIRRCTGLKASKLSRSRMAKDRRRIRGTASKAIMVFPASLSSTRKSKIPRRNHHFTIPPHRYSPQRLDLHLVLLRQSTQTDTERRNWQTPYGRRNRRNRDN